MQTKIREIREMRGLSQEGLAEKSNVSRAIISGLENGTPRDTMLNTLHKIAGALDVKINDLFFDESV